MLNSSLLVFVGANILAVIIMTIASMSLGFVWYHEKVLGKIYRNSLEKTKEDITPDPKAMGLTSITAFLHVSTMAFFIVLTGATTVGEGMLVGFIAWIGFIFATNFGSVIFEDRKLSTFAVSMGFELVLNLMYGIVFVLIATA